MYYFIFDLLFMNVDEHPGISLGRERILVHYFEGKFRDNTVTGGPNFHQI